MTLIPRWGAAWGRSLVVECVTDRMPASVERRQTDSRLLQFTCRMGTSGVRALPIVMLLLLTSCSLPATTSPSSSPTSSSVPAAGEETHAAIDSGRILFGVEGRTGSGGTELRVLHGSELEQVETGDPTLAHVAWAGGDAIVYDSEPTPGRQVYRRADFHDAAAELLAPNAIAGSADAAVSA